MATIYRIYYTTPSGNVEAQDHTVLTEALAATEHYRKVKCRFVTMVSESSELVGQLGSAGVVDGKLPNGETYTYTKHDALSQRFKTPSISTDNVLVPLVEE